MLRPDNGASAWSRDGAHNPHPGLPPGSISLSHPGPRADQHRWREYLWSPDTKLGGDGHMS